MDPVKIPLTCDLKSQKYPFLSTKILPQKSPKNRPSKDCPDFRDKKPSHHEFNLNS